MVPILSLLALLFAAQNTTLVSVDSAGEIGNGQHPSAVISADGRWIGFVSPANNLVAGDTNGFLDVFVHDRWTGATERVSVDSQGLQGNGHCSYHDPSTGFEVGHLQLSADGRFVVFQSYATNLVPNDTNGVGDVFLRDRLNGTTIRVSRNSQGAEGSQVSRRPCISADGRKIAFESLADNLELPDTNAAWDVFVHDRLTGKTSRVSESPSGIQGDHDSTEASISGDGRRVAFESRAGNFMLGDRGSGTDVFVKDLVTGAMRCVTMNLSGAVANSTANTPMISSDGRYVAFESAYPNLVAGDTNQCSDVFVGDLALGVIERISVDSAGLQGAEDAQSPFISADGRYVCFTSRYDGFVAADANGATDVFMRDRVARITSRVSIGTFDEEGDYGSAMWAGFAAISATGDEVVFSSSATNFGPYSSGAALFVRDFSGVNLRLEGVSPGTVDATIRGLAPGGYAYLMRGDAGVSQVAAGSCAGFRLSLGAPRLLATLIGDAAGNAFITFQAPIQAAGLRLQVIEAADCDRSNAIEVPLRALRLSRSGFCLSSQNVTLSLSGATPHGQVAVLVGSGGSTVLGSSRCLGTTVSMAAPQLLALLTADAFGNGSFSFLPPRIMCGATLQAIEDGSCITSNISILH